jgi:hypothetical protein
MVGSISGNTGGERVLKLFQTHTGESLKVPVVIVYLTASINADGKVRFYKDIYNRDQKVLDALNGPIVISPPGA